MCSAISKHSENVLRNGQKRTAVKQSLHNYNIGQWQNNRKNDGISVLKCLFRLELLVKGSKPMHCRTKTWAPQRNGVVFIPAGCPCLLCTPSSSTKRSHPGKQQRKPGSKAGGIAERLQDAGYGALIHLFLQRRKLSSLFFFQLISYQCNTGKLRTAAKI